MQKKTAGSTVDFIPAKHILGAVEEVARRSIRGGEDPEFVIKEVTKGFSEEDIKAVTNQVMTELGFGVNDWNIDTKEKEEVKPHEYEHSVEMTKQKGGKGSRAEDYKEEIKKQEEALKTFKDRLKDAEKDKYSHSSTYRTMLERVEDTEKRIKELKTASILVSKTAWYAAKYDAFKPVTPISVFEKAGKMFITIKTAEGIEQTVEPDQLAEKPAFTPPSEAEQLHERFLSQVIQANEVLSAVQGLDVTAIQGDNMVKSTFDNFVTYLEKFIQKLKERDNELDFEQTEKDNAYFSVKQFIEEMVKTSTQLSPEERTRLGNMVNVLKDMIKVKAASTEGNAIVKLQSIGNPEKLLAYALMTVEDISSKVAEIQKTIPAGDSVILHDVDSINDTIKGIKSYITEQLPAKSRDEQITAATVLQSVASDLSKAFSAVKLAQKPAINYVAAYTIKPALKRTAMMLRIVEA
jgi:hypothetical protein